MSARKGTQSTEKSSRWQFHYSQIGDSFRRDSPTPFRTTRQLTWQGFRLIEKSNYSWKYVRAIPSWIHKETRYNHCRKTVCWWESTLSMATRCISGITHWPLLNSIHYNDVIMSAMTHQITGVCIACSNICSGADQRKHRISASLAFVRGIHRWPVDSPHKGPVTGKMFPFDDVIMCHFKQMYNVIIISIMVTRAFPLEMLTEVFPKILSVINLKWFRWWLAAVRQQKFTWIIIKTDLRHNRLEGIDLSNNDLWKVLVPSHQWPDSVSKYICCYLCHVTGYN